MAHRTFSLFVFIAVTFLFVTSVPAQGFGLVQKDYDEYAKLFKASKEPNLSHHPELGSAKWRKLYRDHNWKGYAAGSESRDPLPVAQVLMGIYLTSFVDHELTYQIDSIILHKSHMSNSLAENIVLDRIAMYMQATPSLLAAMAAQGVSFYSEDELNKMQEISSDVDVIARKRLVSGGQITHHQRAEIRSVKNLFHQDTEGWAATYYFMREKFLVLDALANSFAFNWDEEKRSEELEKLMESDIVKRTAEERIRNIRVAPTRGSMANSDLYGSYDSSGDYDSSGGGYDDDGYSDSNDMGSFAPVQPVATGLSEEEVQKMKDEMPRTVAEELLQAKEARHNAYKYIVGVYESSEYHLETLRKIYRYYLNAANQGDPIAQYHLALFLRYLGDIMGEDKGEAEHEAQEWLNKALTSDLAKKRVEELNTYFMLENKEEEKRKAAQEKRTEALKKVEEEKLDMIDGVLVKVSQRLGRSGGGGGARGSNASSADGGSGGGGRGTTRSRR